MMEKIKFFEELKELPFRIVDDLAEIKAMEERNKIRLMDYREHEQYIKEAYDELERLIEIWNWNEVEK